MALTVRSRAESQPQHSTVSQTAPLTLIERRDEHAMTAAERAALVAGWIMFGGYFVYNGIRHLADREMLAGYAKSKGVRWPKLAVLGTGAMMLVHSRRSGLQRTRARCR